MDRREFLRRSAVLVGGTSLLPVALVGRSVGAQGVPPSSIGSGPYGPLSSSPDANGLFLPAGFTSRVVATGGEVVDATGYTWPPRPDGAGTIAAADGGWTYLCNSNLASILPPGVGGVSAIDFAPDGTVRDAYSVVTGTQANSGGCFTPWGTWLSCEEDVLTEQGVVWECDPAGGSATARPALGLFGHLSVAVDPVEGRVYLTQAHPSGLLYRFTPTVAENLSDGVLEACILADDGSVSWAPVGDPTAQGTPTRDQVPGARVFPGGGGAICVGGWLYFTSRGDHAVHGIDLAAQRYRLIWKGNPETAGVAGAVLSGCDAITVALRSGDLYVAEDKADGDVVIITPDGQVAPFVRMGGIRITGPVFDPTGTRLYVSSQQAATPRAVGEIVPGQNAEEFTAGVTYEISGPFRGDAVPAVTTTVATTEPPTTVPPTEAPVTTVPATAAPTTVPATTTVSTVATTGGGGGGSLGGLFGGGLLALALGGGYVLFRRWQNRPQDEPVEPEGAEQSAPADVPAPVEPPAPVAPVPVEPEPTVASEPSLATIDPDPVPGFEEEEEETFRPLLGTQPLEERPADPSSARTLYDRSRDAQEASNARILNPDDAERLATPVQWKADRRPGDTESADDDDEDDGLDFFDDVVETDDETGDETEGDRPDAATPEA